LWFKHTVPRRQNAAFTLVEIMIVVSIIALLAAIAVPSFLRARVRSQNSKFINALRVASDAIDLYTTEHPGEFPADVTRGIVPPELVRYLDETFDWTARTPIGGRWDWDFNVMSVTAAVSIVDPPDVERMTEIDRTYDDGNLTAGRFQRLAVDRYAVIIQR
jgi:prepilin-type N-terminal cleavage/methylation domain-containing protein